MAFSFSLSDRFSVNASAQGIKKALSQAFGHYLRPFSREGAFFITGTGSNHRAPVFFSFQQTRFISASPERLQRPG